LAANCSFLFIQLEMFNPASLIPSSIYDGWKDPRPLANLTSDHRLVSCPGSTPVHAAHLSLGPPAAHSGVTPVQPWVSMASALASNRHNKAVDQLRHSSPSARAAERVLAQSCPSQARPSALHRIGPNLIFSAASVCFCLSSLSFLQPILHLEIP